MKSFITSTLIIIALVICGCTDNKQNANASNASLPNNTPKGQASVVDNVSARNILQVAVGSADHSTLVAAVEAAQIEHVLVNAGPLTVFAPINTAFEALPPGTLDDLLKPENKQVLATILTRHAAPGSFNLEALQREMRKGRKIYTATGDYLTVTREGDDTFVAGAKILGTISTSNGIINVVDKVILPE